MKIVFDMDGTIADTYSVRNWLEKLRQFSTEPYAAARPIWNQEQLSSLLFQVQKMGIEVIIVTWLSKESNPQFDNETRAVKKKWLAEMGIPYDHFCGVPYGTDKAAVTRKFLTQGEQAILFDDSYVVRQAWTCGAAYDPEQINILNILKNIVESA